MDTIGPSALIVAILYFLSRWSLATVRFASEHPGKGRPEVTWQMSWWLAMIVSILSAISLHVWLLRGEMPHWRIFVFNLIVFGGFFIGFLVAGHSDHKIRLGLREKS
jgi:hypothetical protein